MGEAVTCTGLASSELMACLLGLAVLEQSDRGAWVIRKLIVDQFLFIFISKSYKKMLP